SRRPRAAPRRPPAGGPWAGTCGGSGSGSGWCARSATPPCRARGFATRRTSSAGGPTSRSPTAATTSSRSRRRSSCARSSERPADHRAVARGCDRHGLLAAGVAAQDEQHDAAGDRGAADDERRLEHDVVAVPPVVVVLEALTIARRRCQASAFVVAGHGCLVREDEAADETEETDAAERERGFEVAVAVRGRVLWR